MGAKRRGRGRGAASGSGNVPGDEPAVGGLQSSATETAQQSVGVQPPQQAQPQLQPQQQQEHPPALPTQQAPPQQQRPPQQQQQRPPGWQAQQPQQQQQQPPRFPAPQAQQPPHQKQGPPGWQAQQQQQQPPYFPVPQAQQPPQQQQRPPGWQPQQQQQQPHFPVPQQPPQQRPPGRPIQQPQQQQPPHFAAPQAHQQPPRFPAPQAQQPPQQQQRPPGLQSQQPQQQQQRPTQQQQRQPFQPPQQKPAWQTQPPQQQHTQQLQQQPPAYEAQQLSQQLQQLQIAPIGKGAQAVQHAPEQAEAKIESTQADEAAVQHPLQPVSAAEDKKGKKRAPKRGQQPQQQPQQKVGADAPPAQKLPEITMAPRETVGMKPIKRPGVGKKGRKIELYANFYEMKFKDIQVHHYDIDIEGDPRDRTFKRDLITEMMAQNPVIFKHIYHAYDGNKNLYSAGALNLKNGQHAFNIQLKNRNKPTQVKIQHVAADGGIINLAALRDFVDRKANSLSPEILNVLDIVLQQMPSRHHFGIGRYFFTSPEESRTDWGPGLQQWVGYYSSARPSWKYMFAQIDTSIRIFHKEQTLLQFICEAIGVRDPQQLTANHFDEYVLRMLNGKLDALNIEVTHLPYIRTFRAIKLSQQSCTNLKFKLEHEGQPTREVSVAQYFRETYPNVQLRFPQLPCIQVQPANLNRHFPIEVCRVKRGQQYTKMSEKQKADLIRASAIPAGDRRNKINRMVQQRAFDKDPYAAQFGLTISPNMKKLEGRVLEAPTIQYEATNTSMPRDGAWRQTAKYYKPGTITAMMIITFGMSQRDVEYFFQQLQKIGREKGITIPNPARVVECRDPRQINDMLTRSKQDIPTLNFILVVLNDRDTRRNTDMYNALKKAGDTNVGIATQAVLGKNVREPKPQTVENICLKINAKVGGTNNAINQISNIGRNDQFLTTLTKTPVIVFGADVTHPSPQNKQHPSIAAVVASYDQRLARYAAVIGVQGHREEIIVNMQDHVYQLLMTFYRNCRQRKPEKIIFYRDGVGEGQFDQVLIREMAYIQRACQQLEADYKPTVTLIVVQKRHHTRLFPVNRQDESGRAGNIPPGTTVDTDITHLIEFDFYLNSHQGIQGTCKPAHYHVLWDDNNFTADDLQEMTFQLCHLYARCNRSVSIPAPAYYAHLVAFRARAYLDSMHADGHLPENPAQVEQALRNINASCQPHEQLAPGMFFV